MSLSAVKIKDEPLDPGYGDIVPSKSINIKSEPHTNTDDTEEDISKILDEVPSLQDIDCKESPVKIKTEPIDSSPPSLQIKIKPEPEDLPDDFFDCLNDKNFLEAIAEDQSNEDGEITETEESNQNETEENNQNETELDKNSNDDNSANEKYIDSSIVEEIRKLKRKIEKRRHKLGLHTADLKNFYSKSEESLKSDEQFPSTSTQEQTTDRTVDGIEKREPKHKKQHHEKENRIKSERYSRERRSSSLEEQSYSSRENSRGRNQDYDRSRSRSRSRSRKRRYRSRSRSRSVSRHRKRTRSSSRSRSRSRSRSISRSRSPSNSRSRNKRSRSRSIDDGYQTKSKRPTFLEEIAETFAKQGIPFPEKEKIEMMNKETIKNEYSKLNISKEKNKLSSPSSSSSLFSDYKMTDNENVSVPLPIKIKTEPVDSSSEDESFPLPIKIKSERMDFDTTEKYSNNEENEENQQENYKFPAPMIIKQEPVDYEPFNSMNIIEEQKYETLSMRRERVLNSCTEAIKKLHLNEQKKPITRFLYTPTFIKLSNTNETLENRSPLHRINNVKFKFNSTTTNIDLKMYGIESLPENTAKIAAIIGFDAKNIMERLNQKDLPYSLKILKKSKNNENDNDDNNDKDTKSNRFYRPFYTSTSTQTEPYSCSACIIRQLRKYKDTGIQIQPFVEDHCSQTDAQTIIDEIRSSLSTVRSMQQTSYYPTVGNQQQHPQPVPPPVPPSSMMYSNYRPPQQQGMPQNQFMNSYPSYPYPGQPPISGYGQQPSNMVPISNMPGYIQPHQPQPPIPLPSQQQQTSRYPSNIRSHPGPRTLPSSTLPSPNQSSSSLGIRRNNVIIPTKYSNTR